MIRRKNPSYRHHKPTDQAFVELSGKRLYLGRHGTPASRAEYKRLVAEWLGNGRQIPVPSSDLTVAELCSRFMRHAETYYRKPGGTPTSEICTFRSAIRVLTHIYSETPVSDFGPRALKAVREAMIAGETAPADPPADGKPPKVRKPWSRKHVNEMVSRVRMIFKWGVAEELIPAATYLAIHTVKGLKRGRCEVRETDPVKPVASGNLEAVKAHVSKQNRSADRPATFDRRPSR